MADDLQPADRFTLSAPSLMGAALFGVLAAATLCAILNELGVDDRLIELVLGGLVTVAMIGIALVARSGRSGDHFAAGDGLPPLASGLAMAAMFFFAATALLPGLLYQTGFDGLIPLVGLTCGLVLVGVLTGPALRRAGAVTIADLLGLRFGRVVRFLAMAIAITVSAGLLMATFQLAASLASRTFLVPVDVAAAVGAGLVLMIVLPGGLRSTAWSAMFLAMLALIGVLGVLGMLSFAQLGQPVPQLAYGSALAAVAPAEESLIEAGLVDFGQFKPFLKEFLTVDRLNWALLTLALMAAVAVLPPLLQGTRMTSSRSSVRRGTAWAVLFTVVLLTALPALAAMARLEVYQTVSAGLPFQQLPAWVARGSERDAVRVHGASGGLVALAAEAVGRGHETAADVGRFFADRFPGAAQAWGQLDVSVQEAMVVAARGGSGGVAEARWPQFAETVVTAASAAAGNSSGKPDLAALSLPPDVLLLHAPVRGGLPATASAVLIAIVLGSALVAAAYLTSAIGAMLARDGVGALLGRFLAETGEVGLARAAATLAVAVTATAAVLFPLPLDVVLVASLSLAAAGLFPALVLAIWCRRATAPGVVAGMAAGLAIGAYYLMGTMLYSVSFYDAWPMLSNAGPEAHAEFEDLKAVWAAAEGDERTAAFNDLAARATGGFWSPGLANWFGVAPAALAVLTIPVSLLLALLVSLLTPRGRGADVTVFDRMHPWTMRAKDDA